MKFHLKILFLFLATYFSNAVVRESSLDDAEATDEMGMLHQLEQELNKDELESVEQDDEADMQTQEEGSLNEQQELREVEAALAEEEQMHASKAAQESSAHEKLPSSSHFHKEKSKRSHHPHKHHARTKKVEKSEAISSKKRQRRKEARRHASSQKPAQAANGSREHRTSRNENNVSTSGGESRNLTKSTTAEIRHRNKSHRRLVRRASKPEHSLTEARTNGKVAQHVGTKQAPVVERLEHVQLHASTNDTLLGRNGTIPAAELLQSESVASRSEQVATASNVAQAEQRSKEHETSAISADLEVDEHESAEIMLEAERIAHSFISTRRRAIKNMKKVIHDWRMLRTNLSWGMGDMQCLEENPGIGRVYVGKCNNQPNQRFKLEKERLFYEYAMYSGRYCVNYFDTHFERPASLKLNLLDHPYGFFANSFLHCRAICYETENCSQAVFNNGKKQCYLSLENPLMSSPKKVVPANMSHPSQMYSSALCYVNEPMAANSSDRCLTYNTNTMDVSMEFCVDSTNQKWYYSSTTRTLRSRVDNRCLGIKNLWHKGVFDNLPHNEVAVLASCQPIDRQHIWNWLPHRYQYGRKRDNTYKWQALNSSTWTNKTRINYGFWVGGYGWEKY